MDHGKKAEGARRRSREYRARKKAALDSSRAVTEKIARPIVREALPYVLAGLPLESARERWNLSVDELAALAEERAKYRKGGEWDS
jgi:hypothetical protein